MASSSAKNEQDMTDPQVMEREDSKLSLSHMGRDHMIQLCRKQRALLRTCREILDANGIAYDGLFGADDNDLFSVRSVPKKQAVLEDGAAFFERVRDLMTDGKGLSAVQHMEVRFTDLTVYAYRAQKTGAPSTVASFFLDLLMKPCMTKVAVPLIDNVSGVFKPGRFTLVLGPPGAGKTTLMKTLSNKLKGANLKKTGSILYNGEPVTTTKFLVKKLVGYVDQVDCHVPALTVEETFNLAFQGMGGNVVGMSRDMGDKEELKAFGQEVGSKVHVILKLLGLEHVKDTIVGDDMLRGVSGGQKKRVTLGEMLCAKFNALFLDEISTGLDSASTLDITRVLKNVCQVFQSTTVVSLLQPAPEVYEQFEDILLMSSGTIIYHGPREEILPYFESLGYVCPPRKDVADFLQELTSKGGASFLMPAEERERQHIPAPPTTSAEFTERWRGTKMHAQMREDLAAPWPETVVLSEAKTEFVQSFASSTKMCLNMFFTLAKRDPKQVRVKIIQNTVMSMVIGALFSGLEDDNVSGRMGLFFLSILMNSMGSFAQMPTLFDMRAVFYKQRDASCYPTLAYKVAYLAINVPSDIVCVIIFSSIVYWWTGLTDDAGGLHFFFFAGVLFLTQQAMTQFFLTIVAFFPNYMIASSSSAVLLLFMILFSGYVKAPSDIPVYWLWLYYVDPVSWALTCLAQNEFQSDKFSAVTPSGVTQGDVVLDMFGFQTDSNWKWFGVAFLAGFFFVFLFLNTLGYHVMRYTPIQAGGVSLENARHGRTEGEKKSSVLPFQKCSLAWKDLSYSVDLPTKTGGHRDTLELLHEISGFGLPGTLTALMGSSGAGKTTLLDVLAGRKTGGHISGDIFMNGHPLDRLTFKRISGYVEQTDIHSPHSTVKESLIFSARLRLPRDVAYADLQTFVEDTLETLELAEVQDFAVEGLSPEQKKRVTIGVELVSNPSIIFLDEPTSGLDSRAAMLVVQAMQRLAQMGRLVICTIHQPSSNIFESFDSLLLLKRGGRTVFFGELGKESCNLIAFLRPVPGTQSIQDGQNPAAWMLDQIGAGTGGGGAVDFADWYNASTLRASAEEALAKSGMTSPGDAEKLVFKEKYAASFRTQFQICVAKSFRNYWRSPSYNAVRLMFGAFVAFLFGTCFWQSTWDEFTSAFNLIAVIYITILFMGIVTMMSILPVTACERAVFYREQASNMYRPAIYGIAAQLAEVPYLILTSIVFLSIFYWSVGLRADAAAYFWYQAIFLLHMANLAMLGQLLVCALPDQPTAQVLCSLLGNLMGNFAGFVQTADQIPVALQFMYWINPLHYTFETIIVTQFHGDTTQVSTTINGQATSIGMEQFVSEQFPDMSYDNRFFNLGVMIGFHIVFRVGTVLALTYINYLKR